MCDTLVALPNTTKDSKTLFGKNSDRDPDEVQNIVIFPRKTHPDRSNVKCTYIEIPQVAETAAVLLSQPIWMFGAEMGANEYGVVIGNEALFTKEKVDPIGLLGMDLLRLGLERAKTAKEARDIIIQLLERFGQGGNHGYRGKLMYMNSFLIADANEAYVLETVKKWWAWKQITEIWSISNIISLEHDYDAISPGLIENAVKKGWCKGENDFNFRKCYSEPVFTFGAAGRFRQSCSRRLLEQKKGNIGTADIMNILRDHGDRANFRPDKGITGATVCMHAGNSLVRRSQSVGSMVAQIEKSSQMYYLTGASSPCIRPFFPVRFPISGLPKNYVAGKAEYDPQAYWWMAERSHRQALHNFPAALLEIAPKIPQLETEMLRAVESSKNENAQNITDNYFDRAQKLVTTSETAWNKHSSIKLGRFYASFWNANNDLNHLPK